MKKWLIGSLVTALLAASAPAMADGDNRRGPDWQNPHERGQFMPPGQQKKFLQAHYSRDQYDRDHHRRKHDKPHKWDRKYQDRHRHSGHHRNWSKKHKRDYYHDRHERHHNRHDRRHDGHRRHSDSGRYQTRIGYVGGLPPEARIGRIIHDTHVLIQSSRH